MNFKLYLFILLIFFSCKQHNKSPSFSDFTEKDGLSVLDSLYLVEDSKDNFNNHETINQGWKQVENLNLKLSKNDYQTLLKSEKSGNLKLEFAKRILKIDKFDDSELSKKAINIDFVQLDSTNLEHFAIVRGCCSQYKVYFFEKNHLISKLHVDNRFGLEIQYFYDKNHELNFYFNEISGGGTDIWQNHLLIYKYYNHRIIPVSKIMNDAYLGSDSRVFQLTSTIMNTNPFVMKLNFNTEILNYQSLILKDSTFISYNDIVNTSKNNYYFSKFSNLFSVRQNKDADWIFLKNYSVEMRAILNKSDTEKKKCILNYLKSIPH